MRATLPDNDLEALVAWVDEYGDEFDSVAVYAQGLTMYRAGIPPTTVAHRHGAIVDALTEALESVRRRSSE